MATPPKRGELLRDQLSEKCQDRDEVRMTNGTSDLTTQIRRDLFNTGQVTKGTWWMPWHREAMKDVATCEKLRRVGSELRPADVRMGKPGTRHGVSSYGEYIAMRSQPGELKHLSTRRKGNQQRLR